MFKFIYYLIILGFMNFVHVAHYEKVIKCLCLFKEMCCNVVCLKYDFNFVILISTLV